LDQRKRNPHKEQLLHNSLRGEPQAERSVQPSKALSSAEMAMLQVFLPAPLSPDPIVQILLIVPNVPRRQRM